MIYVASYSADYEFTEIAHVSESLQKVQHSGIVMYGMKNRNSTTRSL